MAHSKPRANGRFTAVYIDLDGRERSAGTYDTDEEAKKVANEKEEWLRQADRSRPDPARRAQITVREFVPIFLELKEIEPSTKGWYSNLLRPHILPALGDVRVCELDPEQVMRFSQALKTQGMKPEQRGQVLACLSSLMALAVQTGYADTNPALRIKIKGRRPNGGSDETEIIVLVPEQFEAAYDKLPTEGARLFANTVVSTGCRVGEAAVLTPDDLKWETEELRISKALQDVGKEFHPDGESRFYVAPYTKNGGRRTIDLDDPELLDELRAWIAKHQIGPKDLIFPRSLVVPTQRRRRTRKIDLTPELVATLGYKTVPSGRRYQHGTWQCYVTAKCRDCDYCRQAFADYRHDLDARKGAKQNRGGSKVPSARFYDTSDYLDDGRWNKVWKQACQEAELPFIPTAYQLRHTHASWLLDAGESLQTVQERLGHNDVRVTTKYIKRVGAKRKGASAMSRMRTWGKKKDEAAA